MPLFRSNRAEQTSGVGASDAPRGHLEESRGKGMGEEDLTGGNRLVSNVIFSWAGHLVFIIAGFVLPRMIDRRLGQEVLGVWDFAWSLVSYFGLVEAGVGGSVNRYVAKFRMAGDIGGVNRTVSTACFVLGFAGLLVLLMTLAVSLWLPQPFGSRLGENTREAQWVVLYLGTGLAVQMAAGAFSGVLMGCHRWKLLNLVMSGWHAVAVVGMIVALIAGYGLRMLSLLFLLGTIFCQATRVVLAYRI